MMDTDETTEKLITQIEVAFRDTPYPHEQVLVNSPSHLECCDDCQQAQAYFAGKAWHDLIDDAGMVGSIICFLNHAAWHYFIPAYLVGNIKTGEYDIFQFEPRDDHDEGYRVWQEARFSRLEHSQRQAVIGYIEAAIAAHDRSGYLYPEREQYIKVREYWRNR